MRWYWVEIYSYRPQLTGNYEKMIRSQWPTYLTASDNAVTPGVGKTLRALLSSGIGRTNALTSFWVTVVAQMRTVTRFPRKRGKAKMSQRKVKFDINCQILNALICSFLFLILYLRNHKYGEVPTLLFKVLVCFTSVPSINAPFLFCNYNLLALSVFL